MGERFVLFFDDAAQPEKKPKLLRVEADEANDTSIEEKLADITNKPKGTIAFWLASEGITEPGKAAGEALAKGLSYCKPDEIQTIRDIREHFEKGPTSMNAIVQEIVRNRKLDKLDKLVLN